MKLKSLLAMAAIMLFAASCSNDDEKTVDTQSVAGTYSGSLGVSMGAGEHRMDFQISNANNAEVRILPQAKGKVTLVLPGYGTQVAERPGSRAAGAEKYHQRGGMAMPSLTVKDVAVKESKGNYTLNMEPVVIKTENGVTFKVAIMNSSIKQNKLILNYAVNPKGMEKLTLEHSFSGTKNN